MTIEGLRNAGIQVWMLTGDKVETATCISISTGLKNRTQKHFFMKELHTVQEIESKLKEVDRQILDSCLMIDGHTIGNCMKNPKLEAFYFEVACKAPVVCVCRCSPT